MAKLEAEEETKNACMSFVKDMLEAGSAYQDSNGVLQMSTGPNIIGNADQQNME